MGVACLLPVKVKMHVRVVDTDTMFVCLQHQSQLDMIHHVSNMLITCAACVTVYMSRRWRRRELECHQTSPIFSRPTHTGRDVW